MYSPKCEAERIITLHAKHQTAYDAGGRIVSFECKPKVPEQKSKPKNYIVSLMKKKQP